MKSIRKFNLIILFMATCASTFAQDVIFKSDGSEITGKVEEISLESVTYRQSSNSDSPKITISANDLLMIKFESGKNHVFTPQSKSSRFKIGQEYQGGVIVHVNENGTSGLIAAKHDVHNFKTMWGPNSNIGAYSSSDGMRNTTKIVSYYSNDQRRLEKTAANACQNFESDGYSDWYLPAIDELNWIYKNRELVPDVKIGDYCSSTEMRKDDAYSIHFRPHRRVVFYYNKDNRDYFIRCTRKF